MLSFWLFVILAFLVIASKPLAGVMLNQVTYYLEEYSDPDNEKDSEMMTAAKRMVLAFDMLPLGCWMVGGVVLTPVLIAGILAVLLLRWMSYLLKRKKANA
jgi:hypothetical protein